MAAGDAVAPAADAPGVAARVGRPRQDAVQDAEEDALLGGGQGGSERVADGGVARVDDAPCGGAAAGREAHERGAAVAGVGRPRGQAGALQAGDQVRAARLGERERRAQLLDPPAVAEVRQRRERLGVGARDVADRAPDGIVDQQRGRAEAVDEAGVGAGQGWEDTFMENGRAWGAAARRAAVGATATAAVALGAIALAGCGDGGAVPRAAITTPPATPAAPTPGARPVDLDPDVTGRQLLWLQRTGAQAGANDIVKFGSDGSAVVIQAYGGGGEKIRRCTLQPAALRRLRAGLAGLPLGARRPAPEREFISMYVPTAARYTLVAPRARHETFTDDTMPRDARPFVRLLEDTLYDRVANCRVTYRSKVS